MVVDENFITFPETIPEHFLWGEGRGREGGGVPRGVRVTPKREES